MHINDPCFFQYFEHIEEIEWAIEVCKETSLPVAATMCIGTEGDLHNVSAGECAVRMARAGRNLGFFNKYVYIYTRGRFQKFPD